MVVPLHLISILDWCKTDIITMIYSAIIFEILTRSVHISRYRANILERKSSHSQQHLINELRLSIAVHKFPSIKLRWSWNVLQWFYPMGWWIICVTSFHGWIMGAQGNRSISQLLMMTQGMFTDFCSHWLNKLSLN